MPDKLKGSRFLVGVKQSTEAVTCGRAKSALVASDADSFLIDPFIELCEKKGIPVSVAGTKKQLGKLCGINVCAACAVLLD